MRFEPLNTDFTFIDPPFQMNHAGVAAYPPEVSGNYLLRSMSRRLGWPSIVGKRLLDFGCGVRLARTLVNLAIDVGFYAGIDLNREAIEWLRANVTDPRFVFESLDCFNAAYNPGGAPLSSDMRPASLAGIEFDAISMFSVITHQPPEDARRVFSFLHGMGGGGCRLYFTALVDEEIGGFAERGPAPGHKSTYHPDLLVTLLAEAGWSVERAFQRSTFEMPAFLCLKC